MKKESGPRLEDESGGAEEKAVATKWRRETVTRSKVEERRLKESNGDSKKGDVGRTQSRGTGTGYWKKGGGD